MRVRPGGTLQARITGLLVVVLLAATALIGVVTALSLRAFLVGRLDQQLASAGGRFAISLEHGQLTPGGSDGDADNAVPGQSIGTLGVRLFDGRLAQSAIVEPDGHNVAPTLTSADVRLLAAQPVDGSARTLELGRLGDYRVQAVAGRDGDVLITGLPQHDVDATLAQLVLVESVVFVVVIVIAAVVVALLVRRTLRPLRRVTDVARHVADLPLTEAATPLPSGLAPPNPSTEVDQVSTAFEHMLDHIRAALAARDLTEERLRQFVADASHEFRTPLASIRVYSESLQRGERPLEPAVIETLGRIDAATARMATLVEDLLLLARLDDAEAQRTVPTDLSQLVVEAVVEACALAPDRRWQLDLPDNPVLVDGDPGRLHRVVGNLVGNARLHTPSGTTVEISLAVADASGTVELVVADDGPGIPSSLQARLFDRFTRGDVARSSAHGSTGLGLAIASGVVAAHGGSIAVVSGHGATRFIVRLPRGQPGREFADLPPNLLKASESS